MSWRKRTIHMSPQPGGFFTPCCGKIPTELPIGDRLTLDHRKVTCNR